MQVLVGPDRGGMITIFSERSLTPFALVVFLRGAPGN
jgi:hypothetical protein